MRDSTLKHPMRAVRKCVPLAIVGCLTSAPAGAQDMEPRAYAPSPIGVRFVMAGVTRSSGGVVVDPSLPIEDVHAVVTTPVVGGGTTFSLFGRTAIAALVIPYARVRATGRIEEVAQEASRSGMADWRAKLSVNLLGGRALTAREFATARPKTVAGMSFTVAPPLGQYFPDKLVNLGANRWGFKPEVGISHEIRRWTIEGYVGAWLFTDNDEFYPGSSLRTQDPIVGLQAHATYTFRPRLFIALDGTWYSGGTTTINGVPKADLQRNSRLGATLALPLTSKQSVKIAYTTGATTRIGGDFDTVAAFWQFSWLPAARAQP